MRRVKASEVVTRESFDMEAARASVVPEQVTFRVEGARRTGETIEVTGVLSNAGDACTIVVFPVGPLGFVIEPAARSGRAKPPDPKGPPRPPPVPPPPLVVELPARTEVHVTTSLLVQAYDWLDLGTIELQWSLHFWHEPCPRGALSLSMAEPNR